MPRLPSAGLALVAFAIAASGCAEVESNVVEVYPYEVKEVKGQDMKRVTMTDGTAARIELQTAKVRVNGERKVVPHVALIYNPDGDVFVYTRPELRPTSARRSRSATSPAIGSCCRMGLRPAPTS